jgi:hypothetical protein
MITMLVMMMITMLMMMMVMVENQDSIHPSISTYICCMLEEGQIRLASREG